MTEPKLAAQVYTIRDSVKTVADFAQSMAKVSEIGYSGIQLDLEHHADVPAREIRRICDDAGLAICICHYGFDLFEDDIDGIIERQKIWSCDQTAIVNMPDRFHQLGEAGYRQFAAQATQIGERLAADGIGLSYHNHSFEFVRFGGSPLGANGLELIFAESDPRFLQAEIDTYWVQHGGGDPAEWVHRMGKRMPVVHYKDMTILANGQQTFAEIGQGNLNWPAIIAATRDSDIAWIVVEQDSVPARSL